MENIFIQIAAGFTPAALIFILLSVFSKRHRARNITFAVLCVSVLAAGLAAGVRQAADNDNAQSAEADNLRFAYALIGEGELRTAKEAITADKINGKYSEEDTLASARIALLGGKIQVAKALYNKLSPETEEKAAVLAIENGSMSNNPAVEAAAGIVWKAVSDYLKQFSSDETNHYSRAAKSAAYAEAAYAGYLENGTVDSEEVKKALRRITAAYEELPELLAIAPLRLSRLKLQLLTEDFKGIAKSVDEYADYNELLIVSELYMNGYIRPSGFSEAWRGGDLEEVRVVAAALNRVYSEQYAGKSREERRAARAQINSLKAFIENPALIRIENTLARYAESDFAYDRSKVYLQLAKTESYMGNEIRSIEYLDRSLNTVGDCDDAEYTAPMYEIIGIIADKDSPERLKDVAVYTDRILTNTMTVQMADALREPVQNAANNDENAGGSGGAGSGGSGSGIVGGSIAGSDSAGNTGSTDENRSGADFAAQMNTYISQKRMAINIVGVDVSEFDTVKASLNISGDLTKSVDELKELLRVADCEIGIHDFTLEKITYTGANILICADVSGSMQGQPIVDLRNAVQMFVESTDPVESVALVAFSSGIVGVWEFGTPNSELVAAAQSLRASGGTDMYQTVRQALGYFTPKPDEINCVILISDGEDNSPAGYAEIRESIGKAYQQEGVTLYSLGLGSGAAGDYLNALAGSTGGKYVYASDSVQIENFFDGIRAQILNSYRLTFQAEDSFRNSRNLRVSIDGESYTYDEFWYTLDGTEAGEDNNAGSIVFFEGKALHGFEEKLIFKGERSRRLNFKGEGFAEEDEFTFELRGNIDYDHLAYEYINGTTLSVTIPAGIACGMYDVRVSVNGRKTVLADGLMVAVQGSEKETVFGDYIFTSYFKLTEGDRTTLSQYVQMNGWLNFRGDVVLTGDLNGQSAVLNTDRPEYVHYYKDTVEGLASVFAGKDVPVPALRNITLYNQYLFAEGDSGELRVEAVPASALMLSGFLTLSSPGLSVYPDRIEINADEFSTALPFQKELLKGVGLFTFDVNIGGAIGSKSIDLIAEIGSEAGDRKGKLAKSPV
ncbi:MAG: VWA domain-containing protein, partial [Lachnospiraceae bacterium]|nr:VWA domain-containing protein [Lachnospiraceae bacterium]